MINFNHFLADDPLPAPTTGHSPIHVTPDPLIDHGGQLTIYIGTALLILGLAATVGFFSRRVEHALITAFVLSLCLGVFFALTR
ncbi:MAG: hypothetical protein KME16_10530 [Scytolyngbya sp. HA4215-MV1]|jgi:hypothetical protein|nr:hypothetical protein [Scytolyngbya sp. HA4215-MV1]